MTSKRAGWLFNHGRRNRGVWGGQCPPHFWDPGGYRGRSNENDLCFYSRQFLFIVLYKWRTFQPSVLERWNVRPTGALPKESLWKTSLWYMWLAPQNTSTNHILDDPEIFHQVLSDVNTLILVLKDSLRTKFKSLSLSCKSSPTLLWRVVAVTCLAKSRNGPKMVPCLLTSTDR